MLGSRLASWHNAKRKQSTGGAVGAKAPAGWLLILTTAAMLVAAAPAVRAQDSKEDDIADESADTPAYDNILPVKMSDAPDLLQRHRFADDEGPGEDAVVDIPDAETDQVEALQPTQPAAQDGAGDLDASTAVLPDALMQDLAEEATAKSARLRRADAELRKVMDLLALPIVVASKREERVFDAIMSVSVITGEEIRRSGAVSLADVMRLLPGVLVREQTPGVALAYVRGFDAVPNGYNSVERLCVGRVLLTIDGRVAFAELSNSVPFGVLPVALEDIERVELIRGPATAMHGPNAVTGVINIVTRNHGVEDGAHTSGSIRSGLAPSSSTGLIALTRGEAIASWQRRPWRIKAVAYYKHFKRHATEYRTLGGETYEGPAGLMSRIGPAPTVLVFGRRPEQIYPRPDLAIEQRGAYFNARYSPAQGSSVDLHAGTMVADGQFQIGSPLMLAGLLNTNTGWSDASVRVRAHGWDVHAEVFRATVDNRVGAMGIGEELAGTTTVEKTIRHGDILVRPGAQLRYLRLENQLLGDDLTNWLLTSGFVRTESRVEQCRIVAALRAERLNVLAKWHTPFELGASCELRPEHRLRLAVGRAFQSPTVVDVSTDLDLPMFRFAIRPNPDMALVRSRSLEAGYRGRFGTWLSLDLEAHAAWLDDISMHAWLPAPNGVMVSTPRVTNLQLRQLGATGAAQVSLGGIRLRLFAAVQRTDAGTVSGRSVGFDGVGSDGEPLVAHGWLPALGRDRSMPTVIGGTVIAWKPTRDFDLSATVHYVGRQKHMHIGDGPDPTRILRAKLLVHATVGYAFALNWKVRLSYRNILDQRSREFPYADRIRSTVVLGLEWDTDR